MPYEYATRSVADDAGLAETPGLITDQTEEAVLNGLAKEGWEFVTARPITVPSRGARLYFRRLLEPG